MKDILLTTRPLLLTIISGILSAAFSFSGVLLFSQSFFIIPLFFLSYLWLVPVLLVSLIKGIQYGIIAAILVFGINLIFTGSYFNYLMLSLILGSALYMANLIIHNLSMNRIGLGTAFSRVCFIYLGLMSAIIVFIFDTEVIKALAVPFLSSFAPEEMTRISESFIYLFPAIMCSSNLILLAINILVTLKILAKIIPEKYSFPQKNDFKIPSYWDMVFLIGLLLILTEREMFAFIGKNVLLLSSIPLYLDGLSIICNRLDPLKNGGKWLIVAIVLSLVLVWPAMIIVLLGLTEPFLKITKRFIDKRS